MTVPITNCWKRSPRKPRSTRGENWLAANWTATSVSEKTIEAAVIVPPAMAERMLRELSTVT